MFVRCALISVFFSLISCPAFSQSINYTYDALGRVTFVEDTLNGNRDYDYDPAGNRLNLATNTATDPSSEPKPPAPTNLRATYAGNCYYNTYWDAVTGAGPMVYYVTDTRGTTQQTANLTIRVNCTYNSSPPDIKPSYIVACNASNACSNPAFFAL